MYNHNSHLLVPGGKTITRHKGKAFQVFNYLCAPRDPHFYLSGENHECLDIIGSIVQAVSDPAYGFDPGMEINAAVNIGDMTHVEVGEKILFCNDVLQRCYGVGAHDSEVDIAKCGCIVISCTIRQETDKKK